MARKIKRKSAKPAKRRSTRRKPAKAPELFPTIQLLQQLKELLDGFKRQGYVELELKTNLVTGSVKVKLPGEATST